MDTTKLIERIKELQADLDEGLSTPEEMRNAVLDAAYRWALENGLQA
jgi:hypothetical protein